MHRIADLIDKARKSAFFIRIQRIPVFMTLVRARIWCYKKGYRDEGLPCWHCVFISESIDNEYYPIWLTCTNPEFGGSKNDGCQWGNT